MKQYAIVGFGCAGFSAAKAIRAREPEAGIHIFSDSTQAPANPMLTTYYAKGAIPREGLFPFGSLEELVADYRLHWRGGEPVEALDPAAMTLTAGGSRHGPFDAILLATGAESLIPPIPGADHPRVLGMRTVRDAERLRERLEAEDVSDALVVGASMTGIKVAELLHHAGVRVTLADLAPGVFPMAALPQTARYIRQRLEAQGLALRLGTSLEAVEDRGSRLCARLSGDSSLEADLVAVCVGTRARTELARAAGLTVGRGIRVDLHMRSSHPGVYAAGDCCEAVELQSGRPMVIGLWANAAAQGRVAGEAMTGGAARCQPGVLQNISHCFDMDFVGVGDVSRCGDAPVSCFRGGGYFIAAAGFRGDVRCLNLVGPPHAAGALRHHMVKAFQGIPDETPEALGLLASHRLPPDFLDWLRHNAPPIQTERGEPA